MNKINWKLRIKNKVTLTSLAALVISMVYQALAICGVASVADQETVMQIVCEVIDVLALIGIVVDPTTDGVSDSSRALSYDTPASEADYTRVDDNRKGE